MGNKNRASGRMMILMALGAILLLLLIILFISSLIKGVKSKGKDEAVTPTEVASVEGGSGQESSSTILEADTDYWELKLGGETVGLLKGESEANTIIQYILGKFNEPDASSTTLEPPMTVEKKTFKQGDPVPTVVEDGRALAEKLLKGSSEIVEYTIESGDSLWGIASSFEITVESLLANNPGLNETTLQPGQTIVIQAGEPDVSVRVEIEKTEDREIDFGTIYEESWDLAEGEVVIVSEGQKGLKTVTFRQVKINGVVVEEEELDSIVKSDPVDKLVRIGVGTTIEEESDEL